MNSLHVFLQPNPEPIPSYVPTWRNRIETRMRYLEEVARIEIGNMVRHARWEFENTLAEALGLHWVRLAKGGAIAFAKIADGR